MKYGEMGSLDNVSETLINITGASVTEANIPNLMLDTNYFIQVAEVNNAGTGVFSNAKTVEQSEFVKLLRNHSFNIILQVYISV